MDGYGSILDGHRLTVVANKSPEPIAFSRNAGGLEDAMLGYMLSKDPQNRKGLWIGVVRDPDFVDTRLTKILDGYLFQKGVFIDDALHVGHYIDASNRTRWPRDHQKQYDMNAMINFLESNMDKIPHLKRYATRQLKNPNEPFYLQKPRFSLRTNEDYEEVCKRCASAVLEEILPEYVNNDVVLIEDYQVRHVAMSLSDQSNRSLPIGYFHHTPIPPYEVTKKTNEGNAKARQIHIQDQVADLHYLTFGVHTTEYLENKIASYEAERDQPHLRENIIDIEQISENVYRIRHKFTQKGVTYFFAEPIGVNPEQIIQDASNENDISFVLTSGHRLERIIKDCKNNNIPLFVGLDRAEINDGIYERLLAFDAALRKGEPLVSINYAIPTRPGIREYTKFLHMLHDVERKVNDYHRGKRGHENLRKIFDLGLSPIYIEEEKITPPERDMVRRRVPEIVSATRSGQKITALMHIIANASNPGENFTIVSKGAGVYEQLAQYDDGLHGIVGADFFNPEETASLIIETLNNPRNRHSKDVIQDTIRRSVDRWMQFKIGITVAAFNGDSAVEEFLKNFESSYSVSSIRN